MKIGMILDDVFPPDPRVENEAIALINNGHEVFLFCLGYGSFETKESINGIQVVRYASNKLIYKLSALAYTIPLYTWIMQSKIRSFIEDFNLKALHIHDMRIAEAVFRANTNFNLPTILDLHDNYPEVMQFYPHLQKFPGKYIISPKKWKIKEFEFIIKANKVITVSPEFIDDIKKRVPDSRDKIYLVPNTVRQSFYTNVKRDLTIEHKYKNDFVLLYLGDTHLRRGLLTAIRSLKYLKDKIKNIKLVIVGENSTDIILKKEVEMLQLGKFVDFEGWQEVALFPSYIMSSDVCISPLYRNKQHDLAYANKLFQYMSLGKPILVSDARAQKDLVERNNSGLVHEEKNEKDFADKVIRLFENKELRDTLGENGKRFVREEFTWDKTSNNLIHLYNNL